MNLIDITFFGLFIVVLIFLSVPLGSYMYRVFNGEKMKSDLIFNPIEKCIYKLVGADDKEEMTWRHYLSCVILLGFVGIIVAMIVFALQGVLPLNARGLSSVPFLISFNTAVSFVTNTNWQAYAGESTMSHFSQMTVLALQNFVSAATGLVVAVVLIRSFTFFEKKTIGNFWVDMTRCTLRILLPISIVIALVLVAQGAPQTFHAQVAAKTLEAQNQTILVGPVASQEAIKQLGTNGGGFWNANSAHPFENPTPLSNFLQCIAILLIPCASLFMFGRFVKDKKQGHAILGAVLVIFIAMLLVGYSSEMKGVPYAHSVGAASVQTMEGKESRFGIASSVLFSTVTTAASCGAVNNMHDSMTPLSGFAQMLQMMTGEVIFGGVGSGMYGILLYVLLAVFIVGLMVGRTPEYIGKKLESRDVKMAIIAILIPSATILVMTALSVMLPVGVAGVTNPGPHGFSQILYSFASTAGNNGSAFAGLGAASPWYLVMHAAAMLLGRYGVIIPVFAIAGNMAAKKKLAETSGTFSTGSSLFAGLLAGIILIVGVLTFFPALALGPILDQMMLNIGKLF